MCPAVGVSLQELAIGAASRSTVARFLIDARRRDGVMTQCVGRLGLKQLPMPVDVPTSRLLALSYRLVDGSQTIQACRSAAQGFDKLSPNGLGWDRTGRYETREADPRHAPSEYPLGQPPLAWLHSCQSRPRGVWPMPGLKVLVGSSDW